MEHKAVLQRAVGADNRASHRGLRRQRLLRRHPSVHQGDQRRHDTGHPGQPRDPVAELREPAGVHHGGVPELPRGAVDLSRRAAGASDGVSDDAGQPVLFAQVREG